MTGWAVFIKIWKSVSESTICLPRQKCRVGVGATAVVCGHYARFLILTYTAARGIYRDKIPIAACTKHRTSDRQHLGIRVRRVIPVFIIRTR